MERISKVRIVIKWLVRSLKPIIEESVEIAKPIIKEAIKDSLEYYLKEQIEKNKR